MSKQPTISTISSGFYSTSALNVNFENIRDQFDNTLSLDGSTPNAMLADLDLNSNNLINGGAAAFTSLNLNGTLVTPTGVDPILSGVSSFSQALLAEQASGDWLVALGLTANATEISYMDGVTSSVQTQLDAKQPLDATLTALAGLATGANKVPYSTGTDTFGQLDFVDEDDMASDSATSVPSQQSVKAYVDNGKADILVVTEQRASGVAGVSGSAGSWTAYALNTTDYNGITGASVTSNQITLPAGTYVIDGFGAAGNGAFNSGTANYKVRLRNVTDATTAISGGGAASPTYAGDTLGHIENLPVVGQITIAGTKVFELQAWFNGGSSMQMYRAMSTGENEVYAGLKITKIA